MFFPEATISPSLISTLVQGINCPAAPIFHFPGRVKEIIGAASVIPNPSSISNPSVLKSFATAASRGAPPQTMYFNSPPNFLCTVLNKVFENLRLLMNFAIENNRDANLLSEIFPIMPFRIISYKRGTPIIMVILCS